MDMRHIVGTGVFWVDRKAPQRLTRVNGKRMFPLRNQTRHFFIVINEKGEIVGSHFWPSDYFLKRRSNGSEETCWLGSP